MNRRAFLETVAAAAVAPTIAGQAPTQEWGSPVFDLHYHPRPEPAATLAHQNGAGVTKANLLARAPFADRMKAIEAAAPGRFTWFTSYDVAKPDAVQVLTDAVKAGAQGFGEMKFHAAADGPEFRRIYALAADLGVPILVHFQEVDHFPKNEAAYPSGPIVRGGVTDKWLSEYPNLFGDLSANSGNNAMSRDAAFIADFLKRHQDKLMFGSDCGCSDGHGGGVSQGNNPAAARMSGKCVARETLGLLKRSTSPEVFRKLVSGNAHRLLKIPE